MQVLYLSRIAANESQVVTGVILLIITAIACAGISVWLYPVIKQYDEALAIGAVVFRTLEAVLLLVAATSILAMIPLSHEYLKGATSGVSTFNTIGTLLLSVRDTTTNILGLLAWNIVL